MTPATTLEMTIVKHNSEALESGLVDKTGVHPLGTNKRHSLNTIQYLGGKGRLLNNIIPLILDTFSQRETLVDLFAGTGSVAYALQPHFTNVIINDIQKYSYTISDSIINGADLPIRVSKKVLRKATKYLEELESVLKPAIEEEKRFQQKPCTQDLFKKYKEFCEDTPHVYKTSTSLKCFKNLAKLTKKIKPGEQPVSTIPPCLFITYYTNTYFGVKQCAEIDSIRGAIEEIGDTNQKNVLLTALMSAMSYTASSTTHFAQYLKVNDKKTAEHLINRRSISILEIFLQRLNEYKNGGLLDRKKMPSKSGNSDYLDFLDSLSLTNKTVVYADPPYFKEHYSRYYHILDTLCLYDYPVLTANKRISGITVGRYRNDRNISPFGKRSAALLAFEHLFEKTVGGGANLVISYSDNSIIPIKHLLQLAERYSSYKVYDFPLAHSKQGRSETTQVKEVLIIARPKSKIQTSQIDRARVDKLLQELEKIDPIFDNPAGAVHHYVARKPFNVVNKIVRSLTEESGSVICDPFAGSGTSLIEALKENHKVIGVDLNEQSHLIMKNLFCGWDPKEAEEILNKFYNSISEKIQSIYQLDSKKRALIERCHFDLKGDQLIPTYYWYQVIQEDGSLSPRKKNRADRDFIERYKKTDHQTAKLFKRKLIENKRIAIQPDSFVGDYLCAHNKKAMTIILEAFNKIKRKKDKQLIELVLSSSINLIRLSDKKASSQIPYWRPKKDLTSRNALLVIKQKINLCLKGLDFAHKNFGSKVSSSVNSFFEATTPQALLYSKAFQDIQAKQIPSNSVDLIITDPPYTDQVPYLEYSQLWSLLLDWDNLSKERLSKELIVSNAKTRKKKDLLNFNEELGKCLRQCARILKEDKYCAIFFHDFSLPAWSNLLNAAESAGLAYQGEARIGRQRRSFKTVLTPNKTLDGNYIILFKKRAMHRNFYSGNLEAAIAATVNKAKQIIIEKQGRATTQDLYDYGLLKDSLESGSIHLIAKKYKTFSDLLKGKIVQNDGFWLTQ